MNDDRVRLISLLIQTRRNEINACFKGDSGRLSQLKSSQSPKDGYMSNASARLVAGLRRLPQKVL